MKTQYILLSAALVILSGGCGQKPANQTEAPAVPVNSTTQAVQEPAKTMAVKKEAVKTDKVAAPKVESKESQAPAVVKETTEQSLADISKHGREVTRTQESKSRTRAQIAEEEMQRDLKDFK